MSGGFFRGTSADQDTRFSNKQAKLLKSQKFAPELEHLVDMRKVKMDVIRPWIANRVTELLGFEDEVLINFIYGLLDAKEVNGKEVQISLTGFMEKNTGKFMKELWTLLISAQKNESGVPQQFLDAKEEETRKKQAEMDRITNEIQMKKEKEGKELERERSKKLDGGAETKANIAASESGSKSLPKGLSSTSRLEVEKETEIRNGMRGRNRSSRSPQSPRRSLSAPRGSPSRSGRSFSNSRSYSGGRRRSRSLSRSPQARRRGISPNRIYRSPRKRSLTPRRRFSPRDSPPPPRRVSSYSRQRSRSRSSSRLRSPSPVRRRLRSPFRHRSPSPIHHRSPSPARRRISPPIRRRRSPSPIRRRRSPSPVWRRRSRSPLRHRRSPSPPRRRSPSPLRSTSSSPVRRRSPLPVRRRSPLPVRRRSPPLRRRSPPLRRRSPPLRRRSPPLRRRSPSPIHHRRQRSPSTPPHESPSPRRRSPLPVHRRSPVASPRRSASPYYSSSPSPVRQQIHSSVRSSKERRFSPVESPEGRVSMQETSYSVPRRSTRSSRSPQPHGKDLSPLPKRRSPVHSKSLRLRRITNSSEDRSTSPSPVRKIKERIHRSSSSSESPARQKRGQIKGDGSLSPPRKSRELKHDNSLSPPPKPRDQKPYHRSVESGKDDESISYARDYKAQRRSFDSSVIGKQNDSPVRVQSKDKHSSGVAGCQATESGSRLDIEESRKRDQEISSEKAYRKRTDPETPEGHMSQISQKDVGGQKSVEKSRLRSNNVKDSDKRHKSEIRKMSGDKADQSNGGGAFDSGSEKSEKHRTESKEKRRHKRSHREEAASDDDDSEVEDKKEAKRRRKEEKKQRKEERCRRREERRRRREEQRAERLKLKEQNDTHSSDDEHSGRRESLASDGEYAQSEQKKLEIELRKKAIESLKAKKGISH